VSGLVAPTIQRLRTFDFLWTKLPCDDAIAVVYRAFACYLLPLQAYRRSYSLQERVWARGSESKGGYVRDRVLVLEAGIERWGEGVGTATWQSRACKHECQ
jgi:hypothetical protein